MIHFLALKPNQTIDDFVAHLGKQLNLDIDFKPCFLGMDYIEYRDTNAVSLKEKLIFRSILASKYQLDCEGKWLLYIGQTPENKTPICLSASFDIEGRDTLGALIETSLLSLSKIKGWDISI